MSSSILYFFLAVLGVPLYLFLDVTNKGGRFSQTRLYEGFKFFPRQKDNAVVLGLILVLLPLV